MTATLVARLLLYADGDVVVQWSDGLYLEVETVEAVAVTARATYAAWEPPDIEADEGVGPARHIAAGEAES